MRKFFSISANLILGSMTLLTVMTACTEKFDDPAPYKPADLTANATIAELKALYTGSATTVEDDMIIKGKVISTDEYGNFYRSLYIQDATSGIEIKVGKTGMFTQYPWGDSIFVKAKHLVLGAYGTFVSLGAPDPDPTDSYQNSYIDAQLWINMTIFHGPRGGAPTPKIITAYSQINQSMYGMLVTLQGMKYTPKSTDPATWAYKNQSTAGGNAGNQTFTFPGVTTTMVVRTSNYATFADQKVPAANSIVNLTGVLTVFNGTIQLILNSLDGVVITSTPS